MNKTKWTWTGWNKILIKDGVGPMDGYELDCIIEHDAEEKCISTLHHIGNSIPNEENWMLFRWDVCDKLLPISDSQWGEGMLSDCVSWGDICEERIQND